MLDGELMPEDRFLHPRLRRSKKVSALTWFERCVWEDMVLGADDFGVLPLLPAKIRGDNTAMMREPEDVVASAMKNIVSVGLFLQFEHQEDTYVCDPNWQDFQKITYPRRTYYPAPPSEILLKLSDKTLELFVRSHESIPETVRAEAKDSLRLRLKANGSRPKAKGRGKAEPVEDEHFQKFWTTWPARRRTRRPAAVKAWLSAIKQTTADVIMAGLARALPDFERRETKFIPHPSTWLNQEGWNDPATSTPPPPTQAGPSHRPQGARWQP